MAGRWTRSRASAAATPAAAAPVLPTDLIERALPGRSIAACERVSGGARNLVYRVALEGLADRFAVRLYRHDADAWRKEADLHRLVGARVPVPEIVFADAAGVVMRWIEGETYREIKARRDPAEIAQCARAMGAVLAHIGEFQFSAAGIIGPGLAIGPGPVEGPDAVPRMIEKFLAAPPTRERLDADGADRVCAFAWARARQLAALDCECRLVHSDFGSPNIVLHRPHGEWEVAGVLDWEFAFSGPP